MTKTTATKFFSTDKNLLRLIRTRIAFFEFLADNDACEYYFAHTDNTTRKTPEEWIFSAFNWADTPQGYLFWSQLHTAWNDLLRIQLTDKEVYL